MHHPGGRHAGVLYRVINLYSIHDDLPRRTNGYLLCLGMESVKIIKDNK